MIGVANDGRPDEGISLKVGRQPRKDWIDQVIWRVDPQGNHKIQIPRKNSDKGVFAIKFDQSHIGPHMAPDCRYYIRAGAHTVQANHFIVESIRARRSAFHPILRAILRRPSDAPAKILLKLVCLTDSPALDVIAKLNNPERLMLDHPEFRECFPLSINAIDKAHPFEMDYDHTPYSREWRVGDTAPRLSVSYKDMSGNAFTDEFVLEVPHAVGSLQIGNPPLERIEKAIDSISDQINHLADAIRKSRDIR